MTRTSSALFVCSLLAVTGLASAAPIAFQTPAFRSTPNSEFAGWESFSVPVGGPNFPDSAATTTDDAVIIQTVTPDFTTPPGILVSGAGNLYSGFQNMNIILGDTAPAPLTTVWLQTRTLGSEWNYAAILLSYMDSQGQMQSIAPTSLQELSRVPGPPLFGNPTVNVENLFVWDLSSIIDPVQTFSIRLTHTGQHLSLDTVELDTLSVPTPGALALAPFALVGLRRRR